MQNNIGTPEYALKNTREKVSTTKQSKMQKVWNSLAQQKLQIPKHEARSLWNITNTFFSAVFKSLLPRCCCWLKFLHKKPPTTENCNSQALLHFSLKVFFQNFWQSRGWSNGDHTDHIRDWESRYCRSLSKWWNVRIRNGCRPNCAGLSEKRIRCWIGGRFNGNGN